MHKLEIARREWGFSVEDLHVLSTVAVGTIRAIENGTKLYKTNDRVAELLAEALDMNVEDLFDPLELSPYGRPGGTGRPINRQHLVVIRPYETLCKDCNIVHPRHAGCPVCTMSA